MANILLLDDNPLAQKAMAGILGRAEHKLAAVNTVEEALKFIFQNVEIDLFITDIRLQHSAGQPLNLVRVLRSNQFLKTLPVLVYTNVAGRENVKAALSLRVQNYLIKPYSDEKIFTEISRALEWGWIDAHFDDPRSLCSQMGITMESWKLQLEDMLRQMRALQPRLKEAVDLRNLDACSPQVYALTRISEQCGFWTLYDILIDLVNSAAKEQWLRVHSDIAGLPLAERFILHMLDGERSPTGFVEAEKFGSVKHEIDPRSWLRGENLAHCPLARRDDALAGIDGLSSFPVFEGRAAAFRLAADGHGSSVQNVGDLVSNDPGLSALVIQTINHFSSDPDSLIEDAMQASQMLGGERLQTAAQQMVTVPEESFEMDPDLSWHRFWMYQYGCAQVCAFVCDFMEIPIFMPHAYWVGMLHDLGKVALAKVFPESFVAASKLAAIRSITMEEAYETLIGVTPQEAGARLAKRCGFPSEFVNVMRSWNNPEKAVEDRELAAVVAFSSALCRRYRIGVNGAPPLSDELPLEKFPGWSILRERVFPSFDLNRFGEVMTEWSEDLSARMRGKTSFVTD